MSVTNGFCWRIQFMFWSVTRWGSVHWRPRKGHKMTEEKTNSHRESDNQRRQETAVVLVCATISIWAVEIPWLDRFMATWTTTAFETRRGENGSSEPRILPDRSYRSKLSRTSLTFDDSVEHRMASVVEGLMQLAVTVKENSDRTRVPWTGPTRTEFSGKRHKTDFKGHSSDEMDRKLIGNSCWYWHRKPERNTYIAYEFLQSGCTC